MKVEKFFFGNGVEILTDNELKSTRGGYGPYPVGIGTCAYWDGSNCETGLSAGVAEALAKVYGGNWCCDNCSTATWIGQCD